MKKKKGGPRPGSRSLAEQLRDAFPPEERGKPGKPAKPSGAAVSPALPQVRVNITRTKPAKPTAQVPKVEKTRQLEPPPPPVWKPPREEIFLEPAFPEDAVRNVLPSNVAVTAKPVSPLRPTEGIRRTQSVARIQVGLDFGTSATKALWVRTGVPERRVSAFDFRHELPDTPSFCIPSVAGFDLRGNLLFGDVALRHMRSGPAAGALTRFKMLVAGEYDSRYLDEHNQQRFRDHVLQALRDEMACTPQHLTAAYLAFVMRRVRRDLDRQLPELDLDVSFATCVPVDHFENSAIAAVFRRVVSAAERIEREALDNEPGRAWLERAGDALSQPVLDPSEARAHLVPEAVASTAGYIHSRQRNRGIHALIDIGAGTTDVSIFNVVDSGRGDPETFWYAARSIPRGTAVLESRLSHELQGTGTYSSPERILALLRGDRDLLPASRRIISEELEHIWYASTNVWADAHRHLKNEVSWKKGAVSVFLSGGGALIPEAASVFRESWMTSPNWGPYPCRRLPDPEAYDERRVGGPFVRVGVAYGLTIPLPELGKFTLPNDAPDHTPPALPRRDWQFDGDQLVPNDRW